MIAHYKQKYNTLWSVLTARFNLVHFLAFSTKRREKYLTQMLELAYNDGKVAAYKEIRKCV